MASDDAQSAVTITECETVILDESSRHLSTTLEEPGSVSHSDLFGFVENLEELVKNFKSKALLLEHEQEVLFSSLMAFKGPDHRHGEVASVIDELTNMLMDVNLKVETKRSNCEEEALHQVNSVINQLVSQFQDGGHTSKELCHTFIETCFKLRHCTEETADADAAANDEADLEIIFQSVITKCAPDDKHRIGRRLRGLLNYIESQKKDHS